MVIQVPGQRIRHAADLSEAATFHPIGMRIVWRRMEDSNDAPEYVTQWRRPVRNNNRRATVATQAQREVSPKRLRVARRARLGLGHVCRGAPAHHRNGQCHPGHCRHQQVPFLRRQRALRLWRSQGLGLGGGNPRRCTGAGRPRRVRQEPVRPLDRRGHARPQRDRRAADDARISVLVARDLRVDILAIYGLVAYGKRISE